MRTLVVGAGATGGYFGARLVQAGRDVTFLVRPRRAAELRAEGLRIVSPHGDAALEPRLAAAGELDGPYDLVLLSVKAYALEAALADIAPAVGARTAVVPVLNGMRHLDLLRARFGGAVLGGLCLISTTLDDAGRIVQLAATQELVYGELDGRTSSRVGELERFFAGAAFSARASSAILLEMWEKWVLLSSLGAVTCLLRGTIGEIEAVRGGTVLASQALDEAAAVARASGYAPREEFVARTRALLTAPGSPLASSMYRDLSAGKPVEADHILGDLLDRAARAGVAVPLLAAAYAGLSVYQRRSAAE